MTVGWEKKAQKKRTLILPPKHLSGKRIPLDQSTGTRWYCFRQPLPRKSFCCKILLQDDDDRTFLETCSTTPVEIYSLKPSEVRIQLTLYLLRPSGETTVIGNILPNQHSYFLLETTPTFFRSSCLCSVLCDVSMCNFFFMLGLSWRFKVRFFRLDAHHDHACWGFT